MVKHYRVAEHVFSLDFRDNSPVWGLLGQYEPFLTQDGEGSLFTMSFTDDIPQGEYSDSIEQKEEGGQWLKLSQGSGGWLYEMAMNENSPLCARVWMSSQISVVRLKMLDNNARSVLFAINNALMLAFALATSNLHTLEMHASMVSNSGRAFLFIAKSGTGKSTHSSLWLKHIPGTELMNDDNPVLRFYPQDGRLTAYGSPWSGKTPCYRNVSSPVGAIVKIRRSSENAITRLTLPEAFSQVYSSCSGLKYSDGLLDAITSTVTSVPCYVLDCRPDEEAALVCSKELLR